MKRRMLIGVLVGGVVFATVFGMAASMTVGGNNLGAGTSSVSACDANGVTASYANTFQNGRYEVTTASVTGIADPSCEGKALKVALTNSTGTLLAQNSAAQTVPTDGDTTDNSVTAIALSATPAASDVANVHVVIGD